MTETEDQYVLICLLDCCSEPSAVDLEYALRNYDFAKGDAENTIVGAFSIAIIADEEDP